MKTDTNSVDNMWGWVMRRRHWNFLGIAMLGAAISAPIIAQKSAGAVQGTKESADQEKLDQSAQLIGQGRLLFNKGEYREAEPLYADALRLLREALGDKHPATLRILNNYAFILTKLGRVQEAEPLYAEVLKLRREALGDKHPDTLKSLYKYAYILDELGRVKESEPLFAEELQLSAEALGDTHPDTLASLNNYAYILDKLGRVQEAEPLYAEALRLRREVLGDKHPDTLVSLNNYAYILNRLERAKEAEPLSAESLRLNREVLGDRHPDTLTSLNNYALILDSQGRAKEAEPLYAEALRLRREVLGDRHPDTLASLNNYAYILEQLGRPNEAEPLYAESLRLNKIVLGDRHPNTLFSLYNYASILNAIGRAKEAELLAVESLRLLREVLGDRHPNTLLSSRFIASLFLKIPEHDYRAIEPARLLLAGTRASIVETSARLDGEAQLKREASDNASAFTIFADAAWVRGPGLSAAAKGDGAVVLGSREMSALTEEAFGALQDALSGTASQAVKQAAANRAAEAKGLTAEVKRRETLISDYSGADAALVKSYAETGEAADTRRKELQAQRDAIAAELTALDKVIQTKAPDYFTLIRPANLSLVAAQKLLGPDEAALMVVPTSFGTHIMLVSDKGISWHRSPLTEKEIAPLVRRLMIDINLSMPISPEEEDKW